MSSLYLSCLTICIKFFFFLDFLASDMALNTWFKSLKLYIHGVKVWIERTVSQITFIGPRICFMK